MKKAYIKPGTECIAFNLEDQIMGLSRTEVNRAAETEEYFSKHKDFSESIWEKE